jgi:hypothetical protein
MTNTNKKPSSLSNLVITIQENEAHIYELTGHKLLHNSTVDNQNVTSYKEASQGQGLTPTKGGIIIDGNEGQWKKEVNKSLLKDLFKHLQNLPELKEFSPNPVFVFYSSNTPKHDLEKEIEDLSKAHSNLDLKFHLENKSLNDHDKILKHVLALV